MIMLTGQTHWHLCLLATTLKPSAYECVVSSHAKTGLSKQGTDKEPLGLQVFCCGHYLQGLGCARSSTAFRRVVHQTKYCYKVRSI